MLFDRDGTLVVDVPYNGDPALVRPVDGAIDCVRALREAGFMLGLISNQSGVGRGMISIAQVESVNRKVDELFGPFDVMLYCPHGPDDGCDCRKPLPGMIHDAARRLGIESSECAVIGDKQSDVDAAKAAGAAPFFVTTPASLMSACNVLVKKHANKTRQR